MASNGKKWMVAVDELVPPFVNGDWIAANNKTGLEFLRKNAGTVLVHNPTVTVLAGCAEYVGGDRCQSGWKLFGIDSSHFRKATPADVRMEIKRMKSLKNDIEEHLGVLGGALEHIQQSEEL